MEHHPNLVLLDSEREQCADENPHSIDAVHVQHLTEVAADDAAVRANGLDRLDRFHGVGDRLVETGNHRLAVGPHVNAQVGRPLHQRQNRT